MNIPLHYSQHSRVLVWVKVHMYRDRLMLVQRLIFAHNGEERLAVHEAHIVHHPLGDSRISVVPMRREEDHLQITVSESASYNPMGREEDHLYITVSGSPKYKSREQLYSQFVLLCNLQ